MASKSQDEAEKQECPNRNNFRQSDKRNDRKEYRIESNKISQLS